MQIYQQDRVTKFSSDKEQHEIWYLMAYDILCHYVTFNFLDGTLMNKYTYMIMDDGWDPSFCEQLVMKYCHVCLKFGWKFTW